MEMNLFIDPIHGPDHKFHDWLLIATVDELSLAYMELKQMSKRMACCDRRIDAIRKRLEITYC